ncbi:hypothetical protein 40AC_61 [Mycobacterium phage 40AC]|uniref:Uncharacterized protein n=1 Tax=Mycobacterium phage 40AC TaxID=1458717 RepID=W8E913_9CAUD|nr:hypothetical protein ST40AC_61 [Mycobacterium phage 40AC]AHJ86424.1 hypothetical protein 40AC_61 [Mycobacterium phage 40AC]
MKFYRVECRIASDRGEEELGQFIEGVLEGHFQNKVEGLSVYEVCL